MIIDAFLFHAEEDLLRLRLATLGPVVDRFLLIEGIETFQGQPWEPRWPTLGMDRTMPYRRKVWPYAQQELVAGNPWDREYGRRQLIRTALERSGLDLGPHDLIMMSDTDEIPHPEAVMAVATAVQHGWNGVAANWQRHYNFYLNNLVAQGGEWWCATKLVPYPKFMEFERVQDLRAFRQDSCDWIVTPPGWHFSYLGGATAIRTKVRGYAHAEFNSNNYIGDGFLEECLATGRDPFDRQDIVFRQEEINATFPEPVQRFPELWRHLMTPPHVRRRW